MMMFYEKIGRTDVRGADIDASASLSSYAPSGSILVPADPPLPAFNLKQTVLDVSVVCLTLVFIVVTAASLPLAVVLLFLVSY
jgi:hypothetical protein